MTHIPHVAYCSGSIFKSLLHERSTMIHAGMKVHIHKPLQTLLSEITGVNKNSVYEDALFGQKRRRHCHATFLVYLKLYRLDQCKTAANQSYNTGVVWFTDASQQSAAIVLDGDSCPEQHYRRCIIRLEVNPIGIRRIQIINTLTLLSST